VRLDHLLSKEHHEEVSALCRCRAVMGPVAVVAPVGCATDGAGAGVERSSAGSSDTLLGFEATRLFWCGVALLWWWGVVFECWIVVASI
jgi:hypothetical protein